MVPFVLFSVLVLLTAVVGCAVIWGYDVARARSIERDAAGAAAERPGA